MIFRVTRDHRIARIETRAGYVVMSDAPGIQIGLSWARAVAYLTADHWLIVEEEDAWPR